MSLANDGEDYVLDLFLEANLWCGLSTADPTDDGSGLAEPVGDGYARVAITAATWDAASGGTKSNGAAITFPEATGDGWGEVTFVCIFNAESGGDLLFSTALDAGVTVSAGKVPRFSAGAFDVTAA
jgi:hypothetical protein